MDIKIRPGQAGDAEAAAQIAVLAWQSVNDDYVKQIGQDIHGIVYGNWKERKRKEILNAFLPQENAGVYVAEENGEIVGFVSYSMNIEKGVGEIRNNAVRPTHQGRGIGTKMYDEILGLFRAHNMKVATVTTGGDDGHAPARKAYEKAGFDSSIPAVTYFKDLS